MEFVGKSGGSIQLGAAMEKELTPEITNQRRIDLVYQAVITLEAQNWANRYSQDSLDFAIQVLASTEEAIHTKHLKHTGGDHNES